MSKVDQSGSCWIWTAGKSTDGYGRFSVGPTTYNAHRWYWQYLHGVLPPGIHMDHLCRNHACVNPDHLEPVTPRENILRGVGAPAIARRRTICPNGHPRSPGGGTCPLCQKASLARYKAKLAAGEHRPVHSTTQCKNGHSITGENRYVAPDGQPGCKQCRQDASRRAYLRRKLSPIGSPHSSDS